MASGMRSGLDRRFSWRLGELAKVRTAVASKPGGCFGSCVDQQHSDVTREGYDTRLCRRIRSR
jgi:hypothetical protein